MVRSDKREKWIIYTLAVLLCMVLASLWLLCGIYARYSTQATGSDDARVAAFVFDVSSESQTDSIPITDINKPGDRSVYDITVANKNTSGKVSEVAESYTIEASLNGSMPLSCTMKKTDEDEELFSINNYEADTEVSKQTNNKEETTRTFSDPAGNTDNYQLEVEWPSDKNDAAYASGSGQAEVVITITGVQMD